MDGPPFMEVSKKLFQKNFRKHLVVTLKSLITSKCKKRHQRIIISGINSPVNPKMIILDDAFQHRYVKPGMNLSLIHIFSIAGAKVDLLTLTGKLSQDKLSGFPETFL